MREIESKLGVEETGDKPENPRDATRSKSNLKKRPNGRFNDPETLDKKLKVGQPPLSPLPGQAPLSPLLGRAPFLNLRGQATLTTSPTQSSSNIHLKPRKDCSGLCARMDPTCLDRQHVVCVSACKDSQEDIEGGEGETQTMTYAIIALLKTNPSPTLRELMQAVNDNAKKQHKAMKMRYRAYEKKVEARRQQLTTEELSEASDKIEYGKVMCKNVQNPQMSSSQCLDLRKTYLFAPSDVDPVEKGD